MAYFSALGGTGGTSATITVTYSEDFYGLTITATNGTTTLTKTATSSGTLVFDVSEGGTWTVSGTVEGATYYEQVDVFFEYTVPPLVALPDGSTALPVNDIQMWLKCAGIRDKTTYTTLSDVLSDTDTLIALCADSNACDYMARSTNWASGVAADSTAMLIVGKYNYCANALLGNSTWASAIVGSSYADYVIQVKVPTMTSNTTPSGQVIPESVLSSTYDGYKAFDNSTSTQWVSDGSHSTAAGSTNSGYIIYKFPSPVVIQNALITSHSDAPTQAYTISGSNDNSTYTQITTGGTLTQSELVTFENTSAYEYYKLEMTQKNNFGSTVELPRLWELQFYGRTPVSQDYTLIHSAVEDSIFYMDEGTPVALCTIASGDTETVLASTIESLKNQTITLYSSVAKDPTNLSNDYSKQIRITPNITEIYLMPDKVLYWYGSEQNVENVISANGWSSAYTMTAPTHNKNSIYCVTQAGMNLQSIGAKDPIPTSASAIKAIVDGRGYALTYSSKSAEVTEAQMGNGNLRVYTFPSNLLGYGYPSVGALTQESPLTVYGWWYE